MTIVDRSYAERYQEQVVLSGNPDCSTWRVAWVEETATGRAEKVARATTAATVGTWREHCRRRRPRRRTNSGQDR